MSVSSSLPIIKYIYLSFHYQENKNFINAGSGICGGLVRIICEKKSFPTYKELAEVSLAIAKSTIYMVNINKIAILSFEEISKEKAHCLFPDKNLDDDTTTQIVI